METAVGVSFPVVFFDGELEIDIGNVIVEPSMDFKNLQANLSRMIGISPNQITVYLTDGKKHLSSPESRRKIPITGRVNFSAILRENDCFFLVVLKRSRRERRRKPNNDFLGSEYYSPVIVNQQNNKTPPGNVVLLRRDAGIDNQQPFWMEYEQRVRNLQMERETYLMNMGLGGLRLDVEEDGVGKRGGRGGVVVCEECLRAREMGMEVGFHWCVYDAVTVGFRSPAGPIARPAKESN